MNGEGLPADRRPGSARGARWAGATARCRRVLSRRGLVAVLPAAGLVMIGAVTTPAWRALAGQPGGGLVTARHAGPAARRGGWLIPRTYRQACASEPTVCVRAPTGRIPAALRRPPQRTPAARPGGRCPASPGRPVRTRGFSGVALGDGPVRVIVSSTRAGARHGVAQLLRTTSARGWFGASTLWFSTPSYQGPFVIRAVRLSGRRAIDLGVAPASAPIVVPPGPTTVSSGGYREVVGGTWVKSPGCYGWEISGLRFSEVVIVRAVLH